MIRDDGSCDSCEALMINGVYCHEHGCPGAWRSERRKCVWCGAEFRPEEPHQHYCSKDCVNAYRA